MSGTWKGLAPHAIRISKKIFFFYRSSHSVTLPSDPIRQVVPYRHPLARVAVGCLPYFLKKAFLRLRVTERIIEYPFIWRNLDAPAGATILDLGATGSRLALELATCGYKVIAVDVLDYPFTHPNLQSWRGDFFAHPFPPASVDAVMAVSTIEHVGIPYYGGPTIPDGDRNAMRALWSLLKPGGLLLLTVPYGQAAETAHQRIYDAAGLQTLLNQFTLERVSFYRRQDDQHWLPADEATMRTVSSARQTEGVALVRARRPLR